MAELHNQLFRGIWSDALKRFLGVTKTPGGIERFGETLTPIIDLWSSALPETAFLRGEALFAVRESQAAVAAEGSMIGISNPANSGKLVVVDKITARSDTAQILNLGLATEAQLSATLAAGSGARGRDLRLARPTDAGDPYKVVGVNTWTGSDATITFNTVLESIGLSVEQKVFESPPYILRPGTGLWVQTATVLTTITATFAGRVRSALPGELV